MDAIQARIKAYFTDYINPCEEVQAVSIYDLTEHRKELEAYNPKDNAHDIKELEIIINLLRASGYSDTDYIKIT